MFAAEQWGKLTILRRIFTNQGRKAGEVRASKVLDRQDFLLLLTNLGWFAEFDKINLFWTGRKFEEHLQILCHLFCS